MRPRPVLGGFAATVLVFVAFADFALAFLSPPALFATLDVPRVLAGLAAGLAVAALLAFFAGADFIGADFAGALAALFFAAAARFGAAGLAAAGLAALRVAVAFFAGAVLLAADLDALAFAVAVFTTPRLLTFGSAAPLPADFVDARIAIACARLLT